MASSPTYNWPEPDNTDLVKNGALAIRTLGNAIDTTMATMVPKSIVDAKGDLIAGTAADTTARLAVGNNGETLVADSSTATGLRWQAPVQQNPVLNSAMQIAQRGTSVSLAASSSGYTLDRWYTITGANQAMTIARQATNDTTNLPNIQYCLRYQRNSGQTGTAGTNLVQSFETVNSIPFAGKTVTMSFYARAGANYSPTSSALGVYLIAGTGTDQNWYNGYTGQTLPISSSATLTTTWQRFTYTGAVGATVTELSTVFAYNPTGTAGANDYFEITGVQLEVGSVATPFKTYAGTIQGELAACQRYYYRLNSSGSGFKLIAAGQFYSSTKAYAPIPFPVQMRTSPTALDTTATASDYGLLGAAAGTNTMSSLPTVQSYTTNTANIEGTIASGGVGGNGTVLFFNGSAGYLGFSAEL